MLHSIHSFNNLVESKHGLLIIYWRILRIIDQTNMFWHGDRWHCWTFNKLKTNCEKKCLVYKTRSNHFFLFLTQKSRIPGRLKEGVSDIQCRLLVLLENEVLNFQPINSVLHNPFDLKLLLWKLLTPFLICFVRLSSFSTLNCVWSILN